MNKNYFLPLLKKNILPCVPYMYLCLSETHNTFVLFGQYFNILHKYLDKALRKKDEANRIHTQNEYILHICFPFEQSTEMMVKMQ